jgi:hypothetical protein
MFILSLYFCRVAFLFFFFVLFGDIYCVICEADDVSCCWRFLFVYRIKRRLCSCNSNSTASTERNIIHAPIHLETCSKRSKQVSSRTQWALSNGVFGFYITQNVFPKNAKYRSDFLKIPVIIVPIRLKTCSKRSRKVPSRTRRALSNGIFGFFITQNNLIEDTKTPREITINSSILYFVRESYEL